MCEPLIAELLVSTLRLSKISIDLYKIVSDLMINSFAYNGRKYAVCDLHYAIENVKQFFVGG